MYSLVLMMALSGSADLPAAHGCCGGCHGCHGCHGGHGHKHGCHGCHGCCGGSSCCGGCCGGSSCCGGCCGGSSCCGGCCGGAAPAPAPVPPPPPPPPPPAKKDEKKKPADEEVSAPATIQVSLPADAKLFIDNAPTTSTTANRVFATPALEKGKEFYYTLKLEVVRDGKTLSATQRVAVRAGEASRITLDVPATTSVASK